MKIISRDFAHQAAHKLDAALLDQQGQIKLFPAAYYRENFTQDEISVWAMQRARYCLPTLELITWLKEQITGHRAIEIGAGQGDLCLHLGIRGTDSYLQATNRDLAQFYATLNQAPTTPPKHVEKREAITAIKKYRPAIVIGAWITQRWQRGDIYGSDWGVEEHLLLPRATYIHIGNLATHGQKRILSQPHQVLQPDWLISRSVQPEQNLIYIWKK